MNGSISLRELAAAALAACLLAPAAAGASSIGFDPAAQSVEVGDAVQIDVVFAELAGEIVSAYDLDVLYDSAVLAATDVAFTTSLGDELFFEALGDFDLSTAGVVDLAQVSLLDDGTLFALQGGDTVTVATLSFEAVGAGTTGLDYRFDAVNDVKGRQAEILDLDPIAASVTVTRPRAEAPVPEPSSAVLYGLGVLVVAPALRRGRHGHGAG